MSKVLKSGNEHMKTTLHIKANADLKRAVWHVTAPADSIPSGWHPVVRAQQVRRAGRMLYWLLPWAVVASILWWI